MKKRLLAILILSLAVCFSACGSTNEQSSSVEGRGYQSPEKAAQAYAEALKTGDVSEILSTFAIETYVENYDIEKHIETNGLYTLKMAALLDSVDPYTEGVNISYRKYEIAQNLAYFYLYFSMGDNFPYTIVGPFEDGSSDFLDSMAEDNWMDILSNLKINKLPFEESEKDHVDALADRISSYLGCEELASVAVEVTLDNEEYYIFLDVACYNGKWFCCTQGGILASVFGFDSRMGGVIPKAEIE